MPVLDHPVEEKKTAAQKPDAGHHTHAKPNNNPQPPNAYYPNYRNLRAAHAIIEKEDGKAALDKVLAKEEEIKKYSTDPIIRQAMLADPRIKDELSSLHKPADFNASLNQYLLDKSNDFIGDRRMDRDDEHRLALAKNLEVRRAQYMRPESIRNTIGGMDPEKQKVWFEHQLQLTLNEMRAKKIPINEKQIVSPQFIDDNYSPGALKNEAFDIHWGVLDMLTPREFRIILAHEVRHTQQPDGMPDTLAEKDSDMTMARVYGSKASASVLQKILPDVPRWPGDPHQSKQQRIGYVLAAEYPDNTAAPAKPSRHAP